MKTHQTSNNNFEHHYDNYSNLNLRDTPLNFLKKKIDSYSTNSQGLVGG